MSKSLEIHQNFENKKSFYIKLNNKISLNIFKINKLYAQFLIKMWSVLIYFNANKLLCFPNEINFQNS